MNPGKCTSNGSELEMYSHFNSSVIKSPPKRHSTTTDCEDETKSTICGNTPSNGLLKSNGAHDNVNGFGAHDEWQPNEVVNSMKSTPVTGETSERDRFASHLHKITDVPHYLRFNPYVLTGYRTPGLTFWQSIRSLSYIHNETVNILTHGIPFICFLVLTPPNIPWNQINHPILAYFHIMGSVSPWLGSTLYHLFMNHEKGEQFYHQLLKWDVFGIWITQSFGASTTVYTSVALYPNWFRIAFISIYVILSIRALYDSAMANCAWKRVTGFTFLVFMRIVGFYCRLRTLNVDEGSQWKHLIMQEVWPITGAIISATRVPERWFPGNFDYVFNSHNIMHVFVVLGALHMHLATCSDLLWLSTHDGNNLPEISLKVT